MNRTMKLAKTAEPSVMSRSVGLARRHLGGRRGLILPSIVALGAAAIFNWGWLVAAGIAPLLLALAPCAAMCALGLCMNKTGDKSCSATSNPGNAAGTPTEKE